MAFLENTTRAGDADRASSAAAARRFSRSETVNRAGGSTAWVCLLLAVLGFGGGLSIALLGFNSSDEAASTPVASAARELRYLPPSEAMLTGAAARGSNGAVEAESRPQASGIAGFGGLDTSVPQSSDLSPRETLELATLNPWSDRSRTFAMGQSISALESSTMGGPYASSGVAPEAATQGAFDAVIAPVPEPSTWVMIVGGAALLLAKLRRRRTC